MSHTVGKTKTGAMFSLPTNVSAETLRVVLKEKLGIDVVEFVEEDESAIKSLEDIITHMPKQRKVLFTDILIELENFMGVEINVSQNDVDSESIALLSLIVDHIKTSKNYIISH